MAPRKAAQSKQVTLYRVLHLHENSERGFDDWEEPRGTFATYAEAKAFAKRDFFEEYDRDRTEAFRMHHGRDNDDTGDDEDDEDAEQDGDDDDDDDDGDCWSDFGTIYSNDSDGTGPFRIKAFVGEGEVTRVVIETITGPALLPAATPTASNSKQPKAVYLIFKEEKSAGDQTTSHDLQQETAYDTLAEANKEARQIFVDKVLKSKGKRKPTPNEKNVDSTTAPYSGEVKGVPGPTDILHIYVKKVAVQYAAAQNGKKRAAKENGSAASNSAAANGSGGGAKKARKSR